MARWSNGKTRYLRLNTCLKRLCVTKLDPVTYDYKTSSGASGYEAPLTYIWIRIRGIVAYGIHPMPHTEYAR